jgi:hypothetical protein
MALKACLECKKEISTDANPCPHCGKKNPHGMSAIVKFGGGFLGLCLGLAGLGAAVAPTRGINGAIAESAMNDIEQQVARDSVAQYGIAKRSGDKIQTCVHAGMVAAAYLQAQDERQYNEWLGVEKADCEAAGMPK